MKKNGLMLLDLKLYFQAVNFSAHIIFEQTVEIS